MPVNPNTLPPLGDPFVEDRNVEGITPQSQPASADGAENEPVVQSPVEQTETPVASLPDKTATIQEQST
jgi:hypothetical protein